MGLSAALLFCSGAASLVFQLLWVKQLTLVVGVEVHATAAVVSAFFSGYAFGSFLWGRVADRVLRPFRLYAGVEMGVGALGALTTFALSRMAPVFVTLDDASGVAAWGLPFLAVGAPAALMGGILPALFRASAGRLSLASGAGRLYAANTAGAVAGALLSPFVLIPTFGILGASWAASSLCLMSGVAALVVDRYQIPRPPIMSVVRSANAKRGARLGLLLYALAGGVALGYEVVWSQAIAPFISTRVFAFSVVLATYLFGLALGSVLYARYLCQERSAWAAFGLLIAAAGLFALLGVAGLGPWLAVPQTAAEAAASMLTGSDLVGVCARFAVAAVVVVLPSTILLGAAFPAALRMVERHGRQGEIVGAAIAVNSIGGVFGAIVAGFFLIPQFGIIGSLDALAIAAALIGGVALLQDGGRRPRFGWLAVGIASLAVVLIVPRDRLAQTWPRPHESAIVSYEESRGGTVAVVEQGAGEKRFRRLYIQGVSNSGDALPSLRYMRLQAMLPLLIHNGEPKSALVIGFGTGITAGTLLAYPDLQRRVVAELLPAVLRAAPHFKGSNDASADPRLEVRLRDGRRELLSSSELYDLITLEPPPPSAAGVVNLYSSDFYQLASSRLQPHGIVAQWLPLSTQNEKDTRSLVRSFLDVFPNVSLWTTELHETLLVGSPDPIALDVARIRGRFAEPAVASSLAEVGVSSPEALLATYVMGRDGLERFADNALPVTDDRPRIEYSAWTRPSEFGLVLPDLMNLREASPLIGADTAFLAAVDARQVELLTFYHAGLNAFAGNRSGWQEDMRSVQQADPENPYYRWFE